MRSALDRGGGHDNGIVIGPELEARIDELSRPQLFIPVREHGLQPDGSRALIDHAVDQQELSGGKLADVVLIEGDDFDWPTRHGGAYIVERACRQREQYGRGLGEDQGRDRALVRCVHDVSGIDQAHSDATVARRPDARIIEIGLRGFDHGGIGIKRGFELIHSTLLAIDVLLAFDVFEHQALEALEVFLGADQERLVLSLLCSRLVKRRLEEPRIDLCQQIALLDVLPFRKKHLLQLAIDLRVDADGKGSLHRPQAGEVDRNVLLCRNRDADRHPEGCGRSRGMRRRRALRRIPVNPRSDDNDSQAKRAERNPPPTPEPCMPHCDHV